jgi:hypothetical protein
MPQTKSPDLIARLDAHLADVDVLHTAIVSGGVVEGGRVVRSAFDESTALRDRTAALVADLKDALRPSA